MKQNNVWVNDRHKLMLIDTKSGDNLYCLEGVLLDSFSGLHAINSKCELFFIDAYRHIKTLSTDRTTVTNFIEVTSTEWIPKSLYCSPFTGDLLVGMLSCQIIKSWHIYKGKILRYDNAAQLKQSIPHDSTSDELYECPHFIAENNNGDVVVSDMKLAFGAIIVTSREERYPFSYRGTYSSGYKLTPGAICTDALCHILVYDGYTDTVQMLDKDGQFLSYLLINKSAEKGGCRLPGMCYDVDTHCLWIGSEKNKVSEYRYIERHKAFTGMFYFFKVENISSMLFVV